MNGGSARIGDNHRSLVDAVQDYIRDGIVSGNLPPGHHLVERELAEATGASRIPVREAIRALASERFVTLVPRKGAVVSTLVPADLDEIFEVRVALESQEAALAADRASEEEIELLLGHVAAAERAMAARDVAAVDDANAAFHDTLVAMSHNKILSDLLSPLTNRLRWILRQNANQAAICAEHEAIALAIRARDADRARELAHAHVATSKRHALGVLFGGSERRPA